MNQSESVLTYLKSLVSTHKTDEDMKGFVTVCLWVAICTAFLRRMKLQKKCIKKIKSWKNNSLDYWPRFWFWCWNYISTQSYYLCPRSKLHFVIFVFVVRWWVRQERKWKKWGMHELVNLHLNEFQPVNCALLTPEWYIFVPFSFLPCRERWLYECAPTWIRDPSSILEKHMNTFASSSMTSKFGFVSTCTTTGVSRMKRFCLWHSLLTR